MPQVQLFGLGQSAKSTFMSAKKLQNMYAEQRPQGEKSTMGAYGTPGQVLFANFGATPCRGAIEFIAGSVAYVVHRGVFWELNNAGVMTSRGALTSTAGRVSMAHNGTQVIVVDGTAGYIYNTSTLAFTQIVDVDFPSTPTTVTFLGGRFVISLATGGRFYESAMYDGLSWDALRFASAETNPDAIVSVWSSNGQLILFGTGTTEYWGLSGALDFSFAPLQGTATEWGLAARWSIAKYDNTMACLIKNRMGQTMLAKLAGYLPEKISTLDMDSIINGYGDTSDASAYSYMYGGHPMYGINFPTAERSWLYDGTTGFYTMLKSLGDTRHNVEFTFNLLGMTLAADAATGKIYKLLSTALSDNGASIERELVTETIANKDLSLLQMDCLRVDMEVGVGLTSGQGENPQIGLSISRDNGKTWGPQMWRNVGKIGEYGTRIEWRRLGTCRAATFRLTATDPVPIVFVSASLNPDS